MDRTLEENLHKALGLFIEAMRPYVVSTLMKEYGEKWNQAYYDTLTKTQKDNWVYAINKNTSSPEQLIDFHNLKGFAIRQKQILQEDFGDKTNNLPTYLDEIAKARNQCYHHQEMEPFDIQRAFDNILIIARQIKMPELEEEITALRDPEKKKKEKQEEIKVVAKNYAGLVPWFVNVRPHLDIRQGNLDESIFAANLAEVAFGTSREIYQNPSMFFSKTYFTSGLKTVARRVVRGLNGGQDAENRVISLQTGFGGGKTHTLISLYHIAQGGKKALNTEATKDLAAYTGEPTFESANIAVFTNTTNDPTQGRIVDGIHIKTLWGELAFQLGGKEAYEIIQANDKKRIAPKGLFKQVLAMVKPCLILIDELADYCIAASGEQVGANYLSDQTISFIQELSEAVSSTDSCVLVATLPASSSEMSMNTEQILTSLSNRLSRVGADTKPVADEEIFEVIRRRLFEDLGDEEQLRKAVSSYMEMYQSIRSEVPSYALKTDYKEKLRKSYPFHPELIDIFRIRWASHHDFQRTRGVLRLLASIVADLWKRKGSLTGTNALIQTSDINFENLDALSSQLKKLFGNGYDAVISADVSGSSSNAFKIDNDKTEYGNYRLTQGIAATTLLGSFGATGSNKGISIEEIKLCILKPATFNHNSINGALDIMEGKAHYLYYSSTGSNSKRYWFHTKPNINILINQAKNDIKDAEIDDEILKRIERKKEHISLFQVLVNPPDDVPEQSRLALIILGPKYQANPDEINGSAKPVIEKLATKKGNSERIYRNTILFLLCSEVGLAALRRDLRNYLACIKIKEEYQSQLEADQREDIKKKIEEYTKQADQSLVAAYSIVAKHSAKNGIHKLSVKQLNKDSLDTQINANIIQLLKEEEWLLESIGIGLLRNNNLLPAPGSPIKARDVYESFVRYDDKPMITGVDAVQRSILKYCNSGEYAVASGDGTNFKKVWYQETVPFFEVQDDDFWLVDKSLYQPEQPDQTVTSDSGNTTTPVVTEDSITGANTDNSKQPATTTKTYKTITIAGKVDIANYSQIFQSFIMPLAQNNVEIEIKIKGKSTQSSPLAENSPQYKITKESAAQLGLNFDAEE